MYKKIFIIFFLIGILNVGIFQNVKCSDSSYLNEVGEGFNYDRIPISGNPMDENLKKPAQNIWATCIIIFQIASVAGIVFAGIRYMFASVDQKADIKKGLISIAIGAAIVFSASTIIGLVTDVFDEII
jgi:hypothetical protein